MDEPRRGRHRRRPPTRRQPPRRTRHSLIVFTVSTNHDNPAADHLASAPQEKTPHSPPPFDPHRSNRKAPNSQTSSSTTETPPTPSSLQSYSNIFEPPPAPRETVATMPTAPTTAAPLDSDPRPGCMPVSPPRWKVQSPNPAALSRNSAHKNSSRYAAAETRISHRPAADDSANNSAVPASARCRRVAAFPTSPSQATLKKPVSKPPRAPPPIMNAARSPGLESTPRQPPLRSARSVRATQSASPETDTDAPPRPPSKPQTPQREAEPPVGIAATAQSLPPTPQSKRPPATDIEAN